MVYNRRSLLKFASSGLILSIAGCASSVDEPQPGDNNDGQTDQGDNTRNFGGLGNSAVFTSGDNSKLQLTPTDAWIEDALIWTSSGIISSTTPQNSNHSYLLINIEIENIGSEPMYTPSTTAFILEGRQYDTTYSSGVQQEQYSGFSEIQPGTSQSGVALFAIPPNQGEGQLMIQSTSAIGDDPTATWNIDLGNIDHESYDYSDLEVGSGIQFGTQDTQYQFRLVDWDTNNGYTYQTGNFEQEYTPSAGNKFLECNIRSENTGNSTVSVPGSYSCSLITGNTQADTTVYFDDDERYSGGEISSGIVREGILLFEVPRSATTYSFRVDLTQDIAASWTFSE